MNSRSFEVYDRIPEDMRIYLSNNGFNFSQKMCEWAVSMMKKKDPSSGKQIQVDYLPKEVVDDLLKKYSIKLECDNGYNSVYVCNMARADYYGSSIVDEQHLALFIKDFIDDVDGNEEKAFRHFLSDCMGKGIVINWGDLL